MNDKLDDLLMQSNQDNSLIVDDVMIEFANVTIKFNNLLIELTKKHNGQGVRERAKLQLILL